MSENEPDCDYVKILNRSDQPADICFSEPKINILPPSGKTINWIVKWLAPLGLARRALGYHHAKFGEDRTTHACCRCENVVFFFLCHAQIRRDLAFDGVHIHVVRTIIASRFIDQFLCGFQHFFQKGSPFQKRYTVLIFVARWRHNTGADLGIKQGGGWRAREREPITGVWGRSPQRGPGAEPLVRGRSP